MMTPFDECSKTKRSIWRCPKMWYPKSSKSWMTIITLVLKPIVTWGSPITSETAKCIEMPKNHNHQLVINLSTMIIHGNSFHEKLWFSSTMILKKHHQTSPLKASSNQEWGRVLPGSRSVDHLLRHPPTRRAGEDLPAGLGRARREAEVAIFHGDFNEKSVSSPAKIGISPNWSQNDPMLTIKTVEFNTESWMLCVCLEMGFLAPDMASFFLEKIDDEPVDFEELRGHSPPDLIAKRSPRSPKNWEWLSTKNATLLHSMRKYTQVHFICHGKCVCVMFVSKNVGPNSWWFLVGCDYWQVPFSNRYGYQPVTYSWQNPCWPHGVLTFFKKKTMFDASKPQ